jgi:uncharacterized protein YjiS (DUF1127 family)
MPSHYSPKTLHSDALSDALSGAGKARHRPRSILAKALCALRQFQKRKRGRAELHALNDHMLRDIGIARFDIDRFS